ncbi:hypothetical protein [Albibacillus kandeliae]|uniref:hypothetical protein n=1 Tax=Albibacillus kandeliae TaxID=2174228 RepID=UPI001300AA6E|nr:hypothetical protein [Albibacillus kandeliae]
MNVLSVEMALSYSGYNSDRVAELADEAGISEASSANLLETAWSMIETYTGRTYRAVSAGKLITRVYATHVFRWPSYPYPLALTVEYLRNGTWLEDTGAEYIADLGEVELQGGSIYRLTLTDAIPASPIGSQVSEAAYKLALYMAVTNPVLREFRSQSAGDSAWSKEQLYGLFYGSGAAAMLSSEVRF